ncbi:MAG: NADH-quinone oxidoreductase subunit C [Hyphomonadaceae bacterium]|nr:MAG: NADH-quinone oxidoreductase subunit C [Hyphomonadaceae bacterium]
MSATKLTELAAKVETDLKAAILSHEIALGELTILAEASQIIAVLSNLQAAHGFSTLVDICGADYPQNVKRFEVVYHLLSMNNNLRVRVKAALEDGASLPSVVSLWPVANWFEREVFDMYGVLFEGHPDLRRLLTDYGFEGHPLRKDFPLTGYQEVRYDEEQKRVIYEPVKLLQEYRDFDFESPWEHVTPDAIPALEAKS